MREPEFNSNLCGAESQAITLDSEDLQVREKLGMRNKSHHGILVCVGMKRKQPEVISEFVCLLNHLFYIVQTMKSGCLRHGTFQNQLFKV
jgi:hypothetical protein